MHASQNGLDWKTRLAFEVVKKITMAKMHSARRLAFVQMVVVSWLFALGQTFNRSLVWKKADVFKIFGGDDDLCYLFILYF